MPHDPDATIDVSLSAADIDGEVELDALCGKRLGAFHVERVIGAGGMGKVYLARDTALGREVALKLLRESFVSDEERFARFDREARLLAKLNHPGIAGIHGIESSESGPFIVMEFVSGGTLAGRLARGPLSLGDALEFARQIADALEAAHESGVIHRDLKPDNVCVTDDDLVKLIDFGIGKPVGSEAVSGVGSTPQMTQAGTVLGTPAYISPEQFKGKAVDRRADIWAFGCLLYEMLTGTHAFPGGTIGEISSAVLEGEPEWAALPVETPERIVRLIRDCLARDPRSRLRDMGEARRLIEDMLAGDFGDVRSAALEPASPPGKRRLAWLLATLAVAVLAFALGRGQGSDREASDLALLGLGGHAQD